MGEPDRAIAALQKLLSIPGNSGPVWATYSSAAPARSDVRSAPKGSAIPKTRRFVRAEVIPPPVIILQREICGG